MNGPVGAFRRWWDGVVLIRRNADKRYADRYLFRVRTAMRGTLASAWADWRASATRRGYPEQARATWTVIQNRWRRFYADLLHAEHGLSLHSADYVAAQWYGDWLRGTP